MGRRITKVWPCRSSRPGTPLFRSDTKPPTAIGYVLRVALGGFDQYVGIPHALYVHAVAAAGGIEQYKRSRLDAIAATFIERLPVLPLEMVRRVVEFAFHVGDYCPGEYEIARQYRSDGWDEKSYLRKLIKAANEEAVFSDD